jgi:hypothetical protein
LSKYLEKNFLYGFYANLGSIYSYYFANHEEDSNKKTEYLEMAIYYYKHASYYGHHKNSEKINKNLPHCYYVLGNTYNLGLADKEKNIDTKKYYYTKALEAYTKALKFNNPKLYKKIKKPMNFVQKKLKLLEFNNS